MKILVCGASGFIGRAICGTLVAAGHHVVRGVRHPHVPGDLAIDFRRDHQPETWMRRLDGVDAVVNAVGILVEGADGRFEDVHELAPIALFRACTQSHVRRMIQISALGADSGDEGYFRTKRAADQALARLPLEWQILRPSLVYGAEGASAAAFRMLASFPIIPFPGLPARARFQPVHIDDLASAVLRALDQAVPPHQTIDCVGATDHSFKGMLETYRRGMHLDAAWWIPIPAFVLYVTARAGSLVPGSILTRETWQMLQRGSAGDATALTRLLGHSPRSATDFTAPNAAPALRATTLARWQRPLLQYAVAAVWLLTAFVCAFFYPQQDSLALLQRVGITGKMAAPTLYGAIAADLAMGIGSLLYPRRVLWWLQIGLIAAYTIIVAVTMPDWLAHPFGPILKNLPILAILVILASEPSKCRTSS